MRRLVGPALLVLSLLLGLVLAAAPAEAAGPVCSPPETVVCISGITFSATTVANSSDTAVTVRVTVSQGQLQCPVFAWAAWNGPEQQEHPAVLARVGSTNVWTGTSYVVAGAAPGTHAPAGGISDSCANVFLLADELAGSGMAAITVTGVQDTTPPRLTGVSLGARTVDTTSAAASVPISLSVLDDVSGLDPQFDNGQLMVAVEPVITAQQQAWGYRPNVLTQIFVSPSSGTITNGIWSGSIPLPSGTSGVHRITGIVLYDRMGNGQEYGYDRLVSLGMPATVTTRTTAAPKVPTSVKAVSSLTYREVAITGNQAVPPGVTNWVVTAPAGCGKQVNTEVGTTYMSISGGGIRKFCTFTLRAVNGFGQSGPVSVNALI